jgi:hypothetical protein
VALGQIARQDIELEAITSHLGAAVRYASNGTQNAAIQNKHQIEGVASLPTEADMDKSMRENEKPTLLTRRQILASGAAIAGAIPFLRGKG